MCAERAHTTRSPYVARPCPPPAASDAASAMGAKCGAQPQALPHPQAQQQAGPRQLPRSMAATQEACAFGISPKALRKFSRDFRAIFARSARRLSRPVGAKSCDDSF